MFNRLPLPKRYYHNGFWLSRYGAVDMLLYLWASDKCPTDIQKINVVKTSPVTPLDGKIKSSQHKCVNCFYGASDGT